MSMSVGDKKGGAIADINVTPMADIMIVLLIIFMVITPLISKGVDVTLPRAANTKGREDKPDNIVVGYTRGPNSKIVFKGVELSGLVELAEKLKAALEQSGDAEKIVFLKADVEAEYGEVLKIMDVCKEAGIEEIAFVSDPKAEG